MLLQDIEVILKVAEFRSITAAATNLDMRVATVSATVKRVEAALGIELFVRTTRKLRLSAAGERYLPECQQAMSILSQAKQNLQEEQGIIDGEIQKDAEWVDVNNVQISYLWGDTSAANGSFVKLPAGFKGTIENELGLKAVVIKGNTSYRWQQDPKVTELSPSGFFSSQGKGEHHLHTKTKTLLYINSSGGFDIE